MDGEGGTGAAVGGTVAAAENGTNISFPRFQPPSGSRLKTQIRALPFMDGFAITTNGTSGQAKAIASLSSGSTFITGRVQLRNQAAMVFPAAADSLAESRKPERSDPERCQD